MTPKSFYKKQHKILNAPKNAKITAFWNFRKHNDTAAMETRQIPID